MPSPVANLPEEPLPGLDVFYGDLTVNRAFVYARLPRPAGDEWSLTGQVHGPRCLWAQTLPVSSLLVDLGPGPTLLARALVPDPCFWSPDLPAIYDVTVNLLRGSEVVATARREIGLRALGVRGRHLALESKRWVFRGVMADSTTAQLPRQWHDAAACYVTSLGEASALERLAEASQFGSLTAVRFSAPGDLQTLAAFPGAAIGIAEGELPGELASQVAPNLLLAQWIGLTDEPNVRSWAKLVFVDASATEFLGAISARVELPVIACRPLAQQLPLAEARAACDELQRDLAPIGQFAGYVV